MSLLVVGSVALDSIFTPFGETADALGGSAVFFSVAGSILHPVRVVGVVGRDYPVHELDRLAARGIDWSGVERAEGESFRWKGKYSYDLQSRETLETRLGVFAHFQPKLPAAFRDAQYLFLGNIDPELQLGVLEQVPNAKLVACDTMNYWIQGKRDALMALLKRVDILLVNDGEARELSGDWNIHRAGRWILQNGPKRVVIKQGEYGALLIFDEVISGFRVDYGGAQALYGIRPDLTVLGKIIGGGLPVGAYGGRKDIMDLIAPVGPVYQAGTLSGNPLAVTAGLATLKQLRAKHLYKKLDERSAVLAEGMGKEAKRAGIPLVQHRVGSMLTSFFTSEPVVDWASAKRSDTKRYGQFFHRMLEQGIYLAPSQFEAAFLSTAHTDADMTTTTARSRNRP